MQSVSIAWKSANSLAFGHDYRVHDEIPVNDPDISSLRSLYIPVLNSAASIYCNYSSCIVLFKALLLYSVGFI